MLAKEDEAQRNVSVNAVEMETDASWSWLWRVTQGVEPCAVKAASTVLNGGDEETYPQATRLVPTQPRCPPRLTPSGSKSDKQPNKKGATMNEQIKHYSDKLAHETDSWDLKVALEAGENIVVIDARSPQAFEQEHIPGAINIPHRSMSPETTEHLDKETLIVTYCDGIGCNASTKGALNMVRLGFRVKELIGGLDWWKRDGHPTEGAAVGVGSGEYELL